MDGAHHRHERQRQARRVCRARTSRSIPTKDKRFGGGVLRRRARAGRIDLGIGARIPRCRRPARARIESAGDGAGRSVRAAARQSQGAGAGLFAARHGHRSQRRRLGRARAAAIWRASIAASARGRSTARPRPGSSAPKGWTLYPEPLPQMKGVTDPGSAGVELLHVGRSVRRARTRREHADRHRQRIRRAARAEGRQVGRAARAVSARLLHEMDGRPHRRSRTADGRAAGCIRPSARARRSTWRPERARRAR